jgi:hypothetical protein
VTVNFKETTMKMWKVFRGHSVIALGLLVAIFAFASLANATLLTPGGSAALSGVTVGAGSTLEASVTDPYNVGTGGNQDVGSVTEWVVADSTNPFGAGDLDFIYQVTSLTVGDASKLTLSNYSSLTTFVGDGVGATCAVCTGDVAGTVAPSGSVINNGAGGVSFNYPTVISPGGSSYLMYIQTSASAYVAGNIAVIDNTTANLSGFAAAPEPGSVGLLLGGLFGLGLFVTRRFRAQKI